MGDYNRKEVWEMRVAEEDEEQLMEMCLVKKNGFLVRCLVCSGTPGPGHFKSYEHVKRVRDIKRKRNNCFQRFSEAMKMYKEHDLGRRYMFSSNVKDLVCQHIFELETGDESLTRAKRLCVRYKKEEPITLLEMALWRTACLLNPTESEAKNLFHFCVRGGWKKHKKVQRRNKMISIIIECVLPFIN